MALAPLHLGAPSTDGSVVGVVLLRLLVACGLCGASAAPWEAWASWAAQIPPATAPRPPGGLPRLHRGSAGWRAHPSRGSFAANVSGV
jgi:hypothetical protein